jgi:phenylacetate-CoA ligase
LYVEIETPRGPAQPGEVGSVLITDLLDHAMPLIRYRIGDMGALASCECVCRHLPRLEKVAGRANFPGGAGRAIGQWRIPGDLTSLNGQAWRQVQNLARSCRRGYHRVRPGGWIRCRGRR